MRRPAWASPRSPRGQRRPQACKAHAALPGAAPSATLRAGALCMGPPRALPTASQAPRPPGTS
eukprot:8410302-Lingulodinium_polyedra.AAC.1